MCALGQVSRRVEWRWQAGNPRDAVPCGVRSDGTLRTRKGVGSLKQAARTSNRHR